MQASGHKKFVALIDKLISKIGIDRVISGCGVPYPFLLGKGQEGLASSAWLTVGILCTWRWPGSCVMSSFFTFIICICQGK